MKKGLIILLVILVAVIVILGILFIKSKPEKEVKKENKKVTTKVTTKKEEDLMEGISLNYHASIRMEKNKKVIYFDPYKIENTLNDADYIFITHSHYDHYSEEDIKKVMNDNTKFIITTDLEDKVKSLVSDTSKVTVVYPNKEYKVDDISFETIPAYNTNKTFHKKSYNWVGYNLELNGKKYYVVGDSDITDELKKVECDVIFIPVGGTYTSTDEEAAEAVSSMNVKYAVPIHYGVVGSRKNAENFVNKLETNIKGIILK